ncbi:hypothetical protein EV700_0603 [Fluviicoccus keumensis]|uniref:Uncharacterized protein n=1 Tax=Fluviicoccus keumensis TaxID=1435465 RepID=A0A4V2G682_9GAMM|nr:hypothetical protein [Fluviicoccus keumensis]RZU47636.1 hypothetical protein EV700_0603 [Fluviicoccus keumensis]
MASPNVKLGMAAVSLELSAVALILLSSRELGVLLQYFALHALACACITPLAWSLMPEQYRQPRNWVLVLLFSLCFFIPVLGLMGFAVGAMAAAWMPQLHRREDFEAVAAPHYELPKKTPVSGWRSGRVRQQISDTGAPLELRMKALLALQNVPTRQSSGILREAMSDSADDLRLLAYGMLDAREQQLTQRIEQALRRHEAAANDTESRYLAARELAELYWELIYQELVQGDMRDYALGQVRHFCREALAHKVRDTGLWVISGRMRLLAGDYNGATGAFATAIRQGFPRVRAAPYLAELAFKRGDFDTTRQIMRELRPDGKSRAMQLSAGFWGQGGPSA